MWRMFSGIRLEVEGGGLIGGQEFCALRGREDGSLLELCFKGSACCGLVDKKCSADETPQ